MRITPNTLTLGNLFNNTYEQFFIPAYQRRYAWKHPQIDALFKDIKLMKSDDVHLLGTVILLSETHNPNINLLEVVDGQQRLTTISIIFKIIQDKMVKQDNDLSVEVKKYLTTGRGEKVTNKILLGDLDNDDYSTIMNGGDLSTVKNECLVYAYEYYKKQIENLGDELEDFYNKLTNRIQIITLSIGEAKDAYKLFETINNRGLKLSSTDIIKNFLLGHASILNNDNTLKIIRENWKNVIVNLDRIDSDKFFRHFMMGRLQTKISFPHLVSEFKNYYYTNVNEAITLPDYDLRMGSISKKPYLY